MTQLQDIESVLALFAEGISGNRFQVLDQANLTAPYAEKFNQSPLSSTLNLYLPREFDFFENPLENRSAYRLLTLQQLAYREFGTFSFDIAIARSKCEFLEAIELPFVYRETDLDVFYRHFELPKLAEAIFQMIEAVRVERLMLEMYAGARRYRRSMQKYYKASFVTYQDPVVDELANLEANLRGIDVARSALTSQVEIELEAEPSVYGSANATVRCYQELIQFVPEELKSIEMPATLDNEPSFKAIQRETRLEEWQEELDELNAELASLSFAETAGDHTIGAEGDVEGEIREIGVEIEKERDQRQRKVNMERATLGISTSEKLNDEGFTYRYDEWDYINARWLKNWCRLREFEFPHTPNESVPGLLDHIQPYVHSVRRQLEQIKPTGMRRVKHVIDGDELDLTSLVEARIDLISGHTPDERIYSRKDSMHRDVCAVLLVDLSASTDATIEDDKASTNPKTQSSKPQDLRDPYFDDDHLNGNLDFKKLQSLRVDRRRVIDIQRESVLLLASALDPLGDLYAVYGFSGYGRDNVELYVAKDFEESLSPATINAIAAMEPKRSTRMGPPIRHSIAKLSSQGQTLKVLIIVSDGFPQDCDYGPDRSDHEYGVQDTAMALREAELKGIQTFCITVDQAGHDYLRKMCPHDRYLVIDEVEELPMALNRVYNLLTSA